MRSAAQQITFEEWDVRYRDLANARLVEPWYGGPLRRHLERGRDLRLETLRFDNSPTALRLWNFLLSEEDRLREARAQGKKLVGTMKDLGTLPVMAYAAPQLTAFYPDGAWWIPCLMQQSDGLLKIADRLGIDASFCPVRALLGAFTTQAHFPIPDLLLCSVGATCDDFTVIAQRLNAMGHRILWWEIPHRRAPEAGEPAVALPGGFLAPASQVEFVKGELERMRLALEALAGDELSATALRRGIQAANVIRRLLAQLRQQVFTAPRCPLPSLELLVAEMLAIQYCSDRDETRAIYAELLAEVEQRIAKGDGFLRPDAVRVFWVNPVADLRAMNLLEECGGRLCGTEFLFCHALDQIPEDVPPLDALAQMALADPMVGPSSDRANRVCAEMKKLNAEALVVSRIPGASHCAWEGQVIIERVQSRLGLPAIEIEVPPVCDAVSSSLRSRLEALVETVRNRRKA